MLWYVEGAVFMVDTPGCGCACDIHRVSVSVEMVQGLGLEVVVKEIQREHAKWAGRCPGS